MLIVFKCLQSLIKQIFSKHQSNFYSRDNFPSQLTQIKPEARTKFCLNNHKWTVKDEIFRELCIAVRAENTRLIAKFRVQTKMLNICLIFTRNMWAQCNNLWVTFERCTCSPPSLSTPPLYLRSLVSRNISPSSSNPGRLIGLELRLILLIGGDSILLEPGLHHSSGNVVNNSQEKSLAHQYCSKLMFIVGQYFYSLFKCVCRIL